MSLFSRIEKILISKFITPGLFILLSVLIVLLIYQNYKLKLQIENIFNASDQFFKKGEIVQDFNVYTLDGDSTDITYKGRIKKFLFFIFSTACPHCERNLTYWNLIAQNNASTCDIMGISVQSNIENTKIYILERDVKFYVVVADTNFMKKYKVSGVPLTMLVSSSGAIDNIWVGELDSVKMTEIDKYFFQ